LSRALAIYDLIRALINAKGGDIMKRFLVAFLIVVISAFGQLTAFGQTDQSIRELREQSSLLKRLYTDGRYREAVNIAERIRSSAVRTFGPEHPDTAMALENLAEVYEKAGRRDDANKARLEAQAIRKRIMGKQAVVGVLDSIKPPSTPLAPKAEAPRAKPAPAEKAAAPPPVAAPAPAPAPPIAQAPAPAKEPAISERAKDAGAAFPSEKTVRMKIMVGADNRDTLKQAMQALQHIQGVTSVGTDAAHQTVTITFDETKTNDRAFIGELNKEGIHVIGKPEYIKTADKEVPAPAPAPEAKPGPPAATKGEAPAAKEKEVWTEPQPWNQFSPIWNVWAEEGSDVQYKPLTKLAPEPAKTDPGYSLYVHLSNCSYEIDKRGFFISGARKELINIIKEYLLTTKPLMLKVILIPDSDFFEPLAKPVEDLEIDLNKIREQLKSGSKLEGDPVDKLIKEKPMLPFFVFGSARFTGVKTRGKEGTGHIGIAIWHDGKPVDDFSVPFCISSSECVGHTPQYSTREKESLPINFSSTPDAALQFFGLGSGKDKVVGIFWNRRTDKFTIWDTGRSQEGFYDQLEKNIVPKLNKSKTPEDWIGNGSALFNLLFPNKTHGGVDSGSEFKEYFKEHLRKPQIASDKEPPFFKPFENEKPPLLFVRFTELKADLPFIIPIGLVAVDMGNGKKEFIGFHHKIETPLANDTATLKPECIKRWVVSLPTKDQEDKLKSAYENIDQSVVTTWKTYAPKEFFDRIRQPEQEGEITSFGAWIEKDQKDKEPAAIITMSHHEKGALSDSSGEVLALNVKREFSQPSIAILDGCGTGEPGATEFIKELNDRGVMTVIATSTSVESPMAGHFISCFGQEIEAARKSGQKEIAVSAVFTGTLKCLYKKPNKYGMKVLKYSLLGDGNLRLCIPGVP
jgi:copper chaperone CopZ